MLTLPVLGIATKCAKLHFVHHKNERRQGAATLPVASEVVGVLTLLEQASRHLAPEAPTIFFSSNKSAYSSDYWSQIGKAALSVGGTPCTARDMRHEFSTCWRDFVDHVPNSVLQMLGSQVEAAAAYLMGNTPAACECRFGPLIPGNAFPTRAKAAPATIGQLQVMLAAGLGGRGWHSD